MTKLSDYHKFELGLLMRCSNTEKITVENMTIIVDCPTCDFECGFPKNKQRKRKLEAQKKESQENGVNL